MNHGTGAIRSFHKFRCQFAFLSLRLTMSRSSATGGSDMSPAEKTVYPTLAAFWVQQVDYRFIRLSCTTTSLLFISRACSDGSVGSACFGLERESESKSEGGFRVKITTILKYFMTESRFLSLGRRNVQRMAHVYIKPS